MIRIVLGGLVFFALYYAMYYIHACFYRRRWKENFELDISFSENQAGEGDQLFLYETAVNNKKMKLPVLCIKFQASRYLRFEDADSGAVSDYYYRNDVMSVDGFQKVRRKLRFTCKKRGLYQIPEAELVSYDIFYTRMFVEKKPLQAELCVYPSRIDIRRLMPVFRQMTGGPVTPVPLYEEPYAYAGVREYTPQDSMRNIHWKASARTGQWQVKMREYQAGAPVVVLLNLESPGVFINTELMEESIRLAYSFVYYLSENGVPTRLAAGGSEMVRLEGNGRAYLTAVRRALAAGHDGRLLVPGDGGVPGLELHYQALGFHVDRLAGGGCAVRGPGMRGGDGGEEEKIKNKTKARTSRSGLYYPIYDAFVLRRSLYWAAATASALRSACFRASMRPATSSWAAATASFRWRRVVISSLLGWMSPAAVRAIFVISGPTSS